MDDILSPSELFCRRCFEFIYRVMLGTVCHYLIFDLMFSPLWLWGYVWTMGQNYTENKLMEDVDGYLVLYQLQLYPTHFRILISCLITIAIYVCLRTMQIKLTVWTLFRFSSYFGLLSMLYRAQQERMSIMALMHVWFHAFGTIFINGFFTTVSW